MSENFGSENNRKFSKTMKNNGKLWYMSDVYCVALLWHKCVI